MKKPVTDVSSAMSPDMLVILHSISTDYGRNGSPTLNIATCDGSDLVLCTVDGGLRAIVFLYVFL